jgi:hypothetical protein
MSVTADEDLRPALPPDGTRPARRIGLLVGLALGVLAVVAVLVVVLVGLLSGPRIVTYVIPKGTGQQIAAGQSVTLMPLEVRLRVGDSLELRNLDGRQYFVGPFTVRANETVKQSFRVAGVYRGACTLNPQNEIRIIVS